SAGGSVPLGCGAFSAHFRTVFPVISSIDPAGPEFKIFDVVYEEFLLTIFLIRPYYYLNETDWHIVPFRQKNM
ncbi:hypothetical protein, partial [Morganella morganii]|uniref:hypothetical protein n=1 Tax=Morganella morganii TaxID=582 RepID=UPI001968150A